MEKKDEKRKLLKFIRSGIRLKTKPPKQEIPKTVYNRKKQKRRSNDDSSFVLISSVKNTIPANHLSKSISTITPSTIL